jgi:hypothetical protein
MFTIRTVQHKNGRYTTKPIYATSREAKALMWVMNQRRIAEQRGILAAAKGLRTLGYPMNVALMTLVGSEYGAVKELLREKLF